MVSQDIISYLQLNKFGVNNYISRLYTKLLELINCDYHLYYYNLFLLFNFL